MSRLSPSLLAFALALALSATPVCAQQINTSQGVRTLPRTDGMKSESQLKQVSRTAEDLIVVLLQDLATVERSRQAVVGDAGTLTEKVKKTNAELERAKTAFTQLDQQYRTDLASFQERQGRLEYDIEQQRNQANVLQALPSAQRDYAEVTRLNDWAAKIGTERTALEAERNRLLAAHDNVEAERAKLTKQKADAEASLKGARDNTLGAYGSAEQKRAGIYASLRTSVNYLRAVREQWAAVAKVKIGRSEPLEQASAKLREYDASKH